MLRLHLSTMLVHATTSAVQAPASSGGSLILNQKTCVTVASVLQALNTEGWIDPNGKSKKPKKHIDFTLFSLWGQGTPPLIQPEIFTASGAASPALSPALTALLHATELLNALPSLFAFAAVCVRARSTTPVTFTQWPRTAL